MWSVLHYIVELLCGYVSLVIISSVIHTETSCPSVRLIKSKCVNTKHVLLSNKMYVSIMSLYN